MLSESFSTRVLWVKLWPYTSDTSRTGWGCIKGLVRPCVAVSVGRQPVDEGLAHTLVHHALEGFDAAAFIEEVLPAAILLLPADVEYLVAEAVPLGE